MNFHWASGGLGTRRSSTPPDQGNGLSHVFIEVNRCAVRQVVNAVFVDQLIFLMYVLHQAAGDAQVRVTHAVVVLLRGLLSKHRKAKQEGDAQKNWPFHFSPRQH